MELLACLFLFFTSYLASAQASPTCEVFTSVASSDAWLAKVRQLPLKQQVAALRQRVACDAGVRGHVFEPAVCLSCVSAEGRRAYLALQEQRRLAEAADPRPQGVVLLCMIDGRPLAATEALDFQRLVTKKSVKKIVFLEGSKAIAIAGTRAADGLVIVTTKNYRPAGS